MNNPSVRTCVGKYELGKTLGEGTFAKVKFAKNVETGAAVAIKVLDKEKILKHKMVEQVKSTPCLFTFIWNCWTRPHPVPCTNWRDDNIFLGWPCLGHVLGRYTWAGGHSRNSWMVFTESLLASSCNSCFRHVGN